MILKPFINYYGGKYKTSLIYPEPKHNLIIEPFAGAAGYSLRHYKHKVKLYEKYDDLVKMWQFLIDSSEDDILSLPIIFESLEKTNIPEGAKILIGFLLNTGTTRPCKTRSKWAKEYEHSGQFWSEKRRKRIAEQVEKIKHWEIHKIENYSEISNEKATWFIDPPYQKQGIHYVHSSSSICFNSLGEWCKNLSGQVIICEQEGANWMPWNNYKEVKSNNKTKTSKEVWYHAEQE